MKSADVHILQDLVNAATEWRSGASGAGVSLVMLTTQINGETVILSWDDSNSEWDIRTQ